MTLLLKRFYALTLFRELGINNSESSNTYEHSKNINHDNLLKKHSDDLWKYFETSVSEDSKQLPSIYWLPKLKKNPAKATFIIAAPTCSVKPLSKYITSCFKLIFNQVNCYNKQCSYFLRC